MNILIAEDSPSYTWILEECLAGNNLDLASDGKLAIDKLKRKKYDCIICDYHMPNATGLDVLRFVRDNEIDTPFMLASSEASADEIGYAFEKYAPDTYLSKLHATPRAVQEKVSATIKVAINRKYSKKEEIFKEVKEEIVEQMVDTLACNLLANRSRYSAAIKFKHQSHLRLVSLLYCFYLGANL